MMMTSRPPRSSNVSFINNCRTLTDDESASTSTFPAIWNISATAFALLHSFFYRATLYDAIFIWVFCTSVRPTESAVLSIHCPLSSVLTIWWARHP